MATKPEIIDRLNKQQINHNAALPKHALLALLSEEIIKELAASEDEVKRALQRQTLNAQAHELGVEGATDMEDKQIAVAIEQASEPTIFINVPKRVVTLKGIVVDAGVHEITEFELNATGLLSHQYEEAELAEDAPE